MDVLWKNLVYSVRMLLKRPSLTAVAIIAIALGIGANTAIFSVVNTSSCNRSLTNIPNNW